VLVTYRSGLFVRPSKYWKLDSDPTGSRTKDLAIASPTSKPLHYQVFCCPSASAVTNRNISAAACHSAWLTGQVKSSPGSGFDIRHAVILINFIGDKTHFVAARPPLHTSFCLSVCLCVYLHVCLSVCLSVDTSRHNILRLLSQPSATYYVYCIPGRRRYTELLLLGGIVSISAQVITPIGTLYPQRGMSLCLSSCHIRAPCLNRSRQI